MTVALYSIINNTGTRVFLVDSNNNSVVVDTGKGLVVSLDDYGYAQATKIFGPSNITLNTATLAFGTNPFEASLTVIRPLNTTPYSAGQLISTATSGLIKLPSFNLGLGANIRLKITDAFVFSSNGNASSKAVFDLYLFSVPAPSGISFNDGANFSIAIDAVSTAGNAMIGMLPQALHNLGNSYGYCATNLNLQSTTDPNGNLYMALVCDVDYVPISGETFTIKIHGLR